MPRNRLIDELMQRFGRPGRPFAIHDLLARPETPDEAIPFEGPQRPSRLQNLEAEQAALDRPPSRKHALLQAVTQAAPIALGAAFGGSVGGYGAAQGVESSMASQAKERDLRRRALAEDIAQQRKQDFEAEQGGLQRQMQEQQRAAEAQREQNRLTEQSRQFNETQARIREEGAAGRSLQRDIAGMKTDQSVTPFEAWRKQNPDAPVSDWLQAEASARQKTATPIPGRDVPLPAEVEQQRIRLRPPQALSSQTEPLYPSVQNGQVVYLPRSQASGQPAPRTLYDLSGMPSTGGVAGLALTPPPPLGEAAQSNLAGWKLSIDMLDKDVMPGIQKLQSSFGPLIGRVRNIQIEKLGGKGATQEEIALATNMKRLLMSQAFAEGGKQLTPTEKEVFVALNPSLQDTVEQAMLKAQLASKYLKDRYNARLSVMSPRQRGQVPESAIPQGGGQVVEWERGPDGRPRPKQK